MSEHAMRRLLGMVAAVLVTAGCGGGEQQAPAPSAGPSAVAPAAATGTARIQGVATYANGDPDAAIQMGADPVCQDLHSEPVMTEKVVTDGGHLANVFVYVKSGISGKHAAPSQPAVIDQKGCQYHPHVSGVVVGQKIVIRNSDPTLHNIHALPAKNAEFNAGQPFQGMEMEKSFDRPEVMVRFKCDVHPWMSSYMGVLEHPYFAVSGADGSFSIGSLPAGTYTLEAWHEELGTQTQEVTVADGQTLDVAFDFKPAA